MKEGKEEGKEGGRKEEKREEEEERRNCSGRVERLHFKKEGSICKVTFILLVVSDSSILFFQIY
jgi:hypothetical protein